MKSGDIKPKKNVVIEKDNDIYTEKGTEDLIEDDEISAEEGAFMRGYLEADKD